MDPSVVDKYNSLPDDIILAEYVWIDAEGGTRSRPFKEARYVVKWLQDVVYFVNLGIQSFIFCIHSPRRVLLFFFMLGQWVETLSGTLTSSFGPRPLW
jgi:hypothetical protein